MEGAKYTLRAGVVTVACCSAATAWAQTASEAGHAEALAPVVVTATRGATTGLGVPASVSVVGAPELERRGPVRAGDAIVDVPGVYVRGAALGGSFPGTGQGVLSLRGIPRTPRTLVMVDGQPVNNALSGGINVAGIPIGSVERVEVVRGPYSALYGGAAMGGVVNFVTASPDQPLTELRVGAGSLRQRGAALVHRKRYASGLGVSFSAAYRESDGDYDGNYVIKSAARTALPGAVPVTGVQPTLDPDGSARYWVGTQGARPWSQSNAQFTLHFSPAAATNVVAGLGWADYSVGYKRPNGFLRDAAGMPVFSGQMSFDDAGTQRQLTMAQTDWLTATPAGERDERAFVRASHRFEGGTELRAQLATLRNNLFFAQATPRVATYDSGPGNFTDQPNRRVDGELWLRRPMSPAWALAGGVSINRSRLDRETRALSYWRDPDSGGAVLNADGGTSDNAALFVQSEHFLDNGLTVYAGLRYDRFETEGRALQTVAPAFDANYPSRSFDQLSPKLALVWEARRWLSLRASLGQAFRPPSLFDLYGLTVVAAGPSTLIYEPSPQLLPERVRALEFGADVALASGIRASATLYRQKLEDLAYRRTLPGSTPTLARTRAENVGEADVDGLEASVRWPLGASGLAAFGSLTHHFRYEISRNDSAPGTVGKKLTDVPRTAWTVGLEYERGAWSALLSVRHVGHVFGSGDDMNLDTVQGVYGSFDRQTVAGARAAWRIDRHFTLSLALDNLTDRRYFVSTRQPGRTAYLELAWRR